MFDLTCPHCPPAIPWSKSAAPSLAHLTAHQVHSSAANVPYLAVIQSGGTSSLKMYPESDHSHHLCCCHFSPSHCHPSPGLLLLVPNCSPSFHPCSPIVSSHTSQKDPFTRLHFSGQKSPRGLPLSLRVKVKVLKMTFWAPMI